MGGGGGGGGGGDSPAPAGSAAQALAKEMVKKAIRLPTGYAGPGPLQRPPVSPAPSASVALRIPLNVPESHPILPSYIPESHP